MTDVAEMIHRARSIRTKLRTPPNAVVDKGIDLRRRFKEQPVIVKKKQLLAIVKVEEAAKPPPKIRLDMILRAVEAHFSVGISDIKGKSRRPHLVLPRHVAIHLAIKHLTKLSTIAIGRLMERDHTTIIHARDKMKDKLLFDTALAGSVAQIEEALHRGDHD